MLKLKLNEYQKMKMRRRIEDLMRKNEKILDLVIWKLWGEGLIKFKEGDDGDTQKKN